MPFTRRVPFRRASAATRLIGSFSILRGVASLAIPFILGVAHLSAGTIQFQIAPLGTNSIGESTYQYSYFLSGFDFRNTSAVQDEFDIRFDPVIFDQLFGGSVPAGFNLLLFQPNVPPGAPGDFSVAAIVDHPALNAAFIVDVAVKTGQTLPSGTALNQTFTFDEFNTSGTLLSSTPGVTSPLVTTGVPEPGSFPLFTAGICAGCIYLLTTRRLVRSRTNKLGKYL